MIHQPPNMVLKTDHLTANLEWNSAVATKMNTAMQQVQRAVDSDALMFTLKYVRQQTGALRDSFILHTVIGNGEVIGKTPYAKEVYYGGGYVNLSVNPFARRRWFDSVIANHKEEILEHAQAVLDRKFNE